ncbi:uncharacterized protein LOC136064280 [Quercus suber]|uniref:uncharacterized protein LOC136064280 n=1 Tax=Quercus suber TaxID=58331 RepID=UPI0032DE744A
MAELVHLAQNFMNAEDAIIAKKRKRVEKVEANPPRQSEQGPRPKKGRTEDKRDREKKAGPSTRNQQYTPLNMPLEQVLMQIKDEPSLKWPEKMKGDPNKRNWNKYCRFHRDHGHDTEECFDLKQQIENLIRQGKLRNFLGRDHKDEKLKAKVEETSRPLLGEIRIILGGSPTGQSSKSKKAYLKAVQNVQLSRRLPGERTTNEQTITFTDEDVERIHHPHDDAIVITLLIADYKTRRVLVDNKSSADIFILLPVTVGAYPQQVTKEVNFLVVDCSSSYNAIIGRPTLNRWKAITSTYHLSVKFPTEHGIGQVQGDQLTARECYLAMLVADEQVQTMTIEEKRVTAEPVEALEDVPLDDNNPGRCTKIGADLEAKIKKDLVCLLRRNRDVFA